MKDWKENVIFLGRKGVGNVIRLFKNVVFDFVECFVDKFF